MSVLRTCLAKVLALVGIRHRDADIAKEIQSHLHALADTLGHGEMSRDDALAAARRAFGGVEQVREAYRDQRGFPVIDAARQDLRSAFRQLHRSRGVTAGAAVSLALGIGFSVAVFTAIEALLLHPFSYSDVDRMRVPTVYDKAGGKNELYLTGTQFAQLREQAVVEDAMAVDAFPMIGELDGAPLPVRGNRVSLNAFAYWGVRPLLGRTFSHEDAVNGTPSRVAVLTYPFWQSHFGGDAAVLGRSLRLDNHPHEIVGVMPPGFRGVYWGTEIYVPAQRLREPHYPHAVRLKLKPGVSYDVGAAALRPLFATFSTESPLRIPRESRVTLEPVDAAQYARFGDTLNMLFAAAALLLAVGCANAGILFLARATSRRDELRVRRALGGTFSRLARQLLAEAAGIAAIGTIAGVLLAQLGTTLIRRVAPDTLFPPEIAFQVNGTVLVFTVGAAVAATLLVGLWHADLGTADHHRRGRFPTAADHGGPVPDARGDQRKRVSVCRAREPGWIRPYGRGQTRD